MSKRYLILAVAYISFMVGMAANSVGQLYEAGVSHWFLPIMMFIVLALPFYMGYKAGKENK